MKFSLSTGAAVSFLSLSPLLSTTQACMLPEEVSPELHAASILRRQESTDHGLAIGSGDRFQDGKLFPRGLGSQPAGTNPGLILSTKEVASAFKGLAKEYGFKTFTSPFKTYENASIFGGQIGGRDGCASVYFNAAIHARERGSSDNLIYFLGDLLYANKKKTGLTYGGRVYTYPQVKKALEAGIVAVPLSNPDGVAWDQKTNTCVSSPSLPSCSLLLRSLSFYSYARINQIFKRLIFSIVEEES